MGRRDGDLIPVLECLVGGSTLFISGTTPTTLVHYSANTTGLGLATGGTLDIRVNHRIAIRPIQLDYLLTRVN